jgi:hypothetical protein
MLRNLQLPFSKLIEIWELRSYDQDEIIKYFGKPPYLFLQQTPNIIPFANRFGKYGKEIKNPQSKIDELPDDMRQLITMDDVGKFMDDKGREYIFLYDKESMGVRLPRAESYAVLSEVKFPERDEEINITKRGINYTINVTDIGNVRKATCGIKVIFL